MKRFEGKNVVITGAAAGIGQATAQRIAEEGGNVALIDINAEGLAGHEEARRGSRGQGVGLRVQCHRRRSRERGDRSSGRRYGRFRHVVSLRWHPAHLPHPRDEHSSSGINIIDINLNGTFYVNHAALPHLLKNRFSALVNCSSTSAIGSHPWMAAYAASKGGVISMTRALYQEYVKQGLRANCVVPGGIATALHGDFKAPAGADMELLKRRHALRGLRQARPRSQRHRLLGLRRRPLRKRHRSPSRRRRSLLADRLVPQKRATSPTGFQCLAGRGRRGGRLGARGALGRRLRCRPGCFRGELRRRRWLV